MSSAAIYLQARRPIYLLLAMMLAGLVGAAAVYEPKLTAAAMAGFFLIIMGFLHPERMSLVLMVSTVVSYQVIYDFSVYGLDLQTANKLLILLLAVPAMIRFGWRLRRALPILAFAFLLLSSLLLAELHPELSMQASVQAFIGLSAPFLLLLIRWDPVTAHRQLRLITFLPLISIAAGGILQLLGQHQLAVTEFNGAFRLQGASIPAHLAFLAFVALMTAMVEWRRNANRTLLFYMMIAINMLILLLTGTRGPLLAAIPMVLVFLFDLSKQYIKGRTVLLIPLFGFLAVLSVSFLLLFDNLMKRSFGRHSELGVDLSGREEAWRFFLDGVGESIWFGRGLGAVLYANDGSLYQGFAVPHNEYIRFYYDGGWVGVVLLSLSLAAVFIQVFRRVPQAVRAYITALLIGFMLYSFTDNTLSTLQFIVPFCFFLGAIAAVQQVERPERSGISGDGPTVGGEGKYE